MSHHDRSRNFRRSIILILSFLLAGCGGSYIKEETKFIGTRHSYPSNQTRHVGVEISLTGLSDDGFLRGSVYSKYDTPELICDVYEDRRQYKEKPDAEALVQLLNPMAYLLLSSGELKQEAEKLTGSSSDWQSKEVVKNCRKTGKTQTTSAKSSDPISLDVCLDSYQGERVCEDYTNVNNRFAIDIKPIATRFSSRPDNLKVSATAVNKRFKDNGSIIVTHQSIKGMGLRNKSWEQQEYEAGLSIDQRKKYYSEQLLKDMKARNWQGSIEWYKKLETLNVELPTSFYFHYGSTLARLDKDAEARAQMTKYLATASSSDRYAERARTLLNEIN